MYAHLAEAETFGVGKTSYAVDCTLQLTRSGFNVGGLLCTAVYRHEAKLVGEETRHGFRWIGHDAILLPEGKHLTFSRIDRAGLPGWELRNVFEGHSTRDSKLPPDRARQHPRLTADRRRLAVYLPAAAKCLQHLLNVAGDKDVDAVVLDEIGTLLGGESVRDRDPRLHEACVQVGVAQKPAFIATGQLRGQHRQHIKACIDAVKEMRHHSVLDALVLNGLEPPEMPLALLDLRPG